MLVTGTNVLAGGDDKEDSKSPEVSKALSVINVAVVGGDDKEGSKSPEVSKALPVINVAVVGDDDKGKKDFIKSYTRIQGQRYYGVQSYRLKYKEKIIKFFDIPSDLGRDSDDELEKKWINNFLKSSKKNRGVPYCTYVIICLNVETEEEELLKRVYGWLKEIKELNKDYQMNLVLYSITNENVSNYYKRVNAVLDVLNKFEEEFIEQNPETEQFRSYTGFPFGKDYILDSIIKGAAIYVKSVSSRNTMTDSNLLKKLILLSGFAIVGITSVIVYYININ